MTVTDSNEEYVQSLFQTYEHAYQQQLQARRNLIDYLLANEMVWADVEQEVYVGPNPFGVDTQNYKASTWRMVTGKHAVRYAQKYIASGISKPVLPEDLQELADEEFRRPSTRPPLEASPKHRVAKGYRKPTIDKKSNPYGI